MQLVRTNLGFYVEGLKTLRYIRGKTEVRELSRLQFNRLKQQRCRAANAPF